MSTEQIKLPIVVVDEQKELIFFKQKLPEYRSKGLEKTELAYLHIAFIKKIVFETLEQRKLSCEKILLDLDSKQDATIKQRQEAIKEYNKQLKELKEYRIRYTRFLDEKLYTPAMKFEKDLEQSEKLKQQEEKIFELRKQATDQEEVQKNKQDEKNKYIAHIEIQNLNIIRNYRNKCEALISSIYRQLLKDKIEKPDTGTVKRLVKEIPLDKPEKYGKLQYLTHEEAQSIIEAITKQGKMPNLQRLQEEMYAYIDKTFQTYEVDLAAISVNAGVADKIALQVEEMSKSRIDERNKVINTQIMMEETYGGAPIVQMEKQEFKPIQKTVEVQDENTFEWAMRVVRAFCKIPIDARKYLKEREDWGNLDIHAMARVLGIYATQTGDKMETLTYKEIEK